MHPVHVILARDDDDGIGKDGSIPWHNSDDLAYFRRLTTTTRDPSKRNAIVVGHRTRHSMPLVLPGRYLITMPRSGLIVTPPNTESIFIAGGQACLRQYIDRCVEGCAPWPETMYLTRIPGVHGCDVKVTDDELYLDNYIISTIEDLGRCQVYIYRKKNLCVQ